MLDVSGYLERIACAGLAAPTLETLRALHLAHLYAVPFENLDIHLRRKIVLDEEKLFEKIVGRNRGGFCFELNSLFAALLRALGFDVALLAAGVWNLDRQRFDPEFDHLCLLVQLEERWLADVGFGETFREPLRLDDPGEQVQNGKAYRIEHDGDWWIMHEPDSGGRRAGGYRFTLRPRELHEFAFGCHYHQTSPDSPFTQKRLCSRATPTGRITLSGDRQIITTNGRRDERELASESEWAAALKEHFGIVL